MSVNLPETVMKMEENRITQTAPAFGGAGNGMLLYGSRENHPMAVGAYESCVSRASSVENRTGALLEKLIGTLDRTPKKSSLDGKISQIAQKAVEISKSQAKGELEINEKTVMLEQLEEELALAAGAVGDTVVAEAHEKMSERIEQQAALLNSVKMLLEEYKFEDNAVRGRRMLNSASKKLSSLEEALAGLEEEIERPKMPDHPLKKKFDLASRAVISTKKLFEKKMQERVQERLSSQAGVIREEMKQFLQRQLEGRVFADSNRIQIRSEITGQSREWKMDDISEFALEEMFEGSSLSGIVGKLRSGRSHLAAKFECRSAANGLLVELDAGERTIAGDAIVFKPHRARIAP